MHGRRRQPADARERAARRGGGPGPVRADRSTLRYSARSPPIPPPGPSIGSAESAQGSRSSAPPSPAHSTPAAGPDRAISRGMTRTRRGRIVRAWRPLRGWGRRHATLAASLLTVAVAAPSLAPPITGAAQPRQLVVEADLLSKLRTLAGGLHHEIVLCLSGRIHGDTAWASELYMPVPHLSTSTRSSFERCPTGTLATWHNHPPARAAFSPAMARGSSARGPGRLCSLSTTDARTAARLGHPFAVVGVDREVWCWWTLAEVRRLAGPENGWIDRGGNRREAASSGEIGD